MNKFIFLSVVAFFYISCSSSSELLLDFDNSVSYNVHQVPIEKAVGISMKQLNAEYPNGVFKIDPAQSISHINDSTIQGHIYVDVALEFDVRYRFTRSDTGLIMIVSVTDNLSKVPRETNVSWEEVARAWGDAVIKILEGK